MTSKSASSQVGAEVIEAGKRDRAWRSGFTRPLPNWFTGAHLADLSNHERRPRFDEMARRTTLHRGWVLAASIGLVVVAAVGIWGPRSAAVAVAFWPAGIVMIGRHYVLRGEFKRESQAFASREGRVGEPERPL